MAQCRGDAGGGGKLGARIWGLGRGRTAERRRAVVGRRMRTPAPKRRPPPHPRATHTRAAQRPWGRSGLLAWTPRPDSSHF
eukprot:2178897-Prymnesium_polylepis.1